VFLVTDEGRKREYSAVIVFPELSGFVKAFVNEDIMAVDNSLTALLKLALLKSGFTSKLFCLVKFLEPILGVKLLDGSVNVKVAKLNDISKKGVGTKFGVVCAVVLVCCVASA
jgi:hypothetical protein